jgi:hypothetical protein
MTRKFGWREDLLPLEFANMVAAVEAAAETRNDLRLNMSELLGSKDLGPTRKP